MLHVTKNYNAVDKLLNEVYQEVKKQIPKDDFKQLITSELRWLKDVDSYRTVFEQQGFGSMGTSISLGYEVDMREFRTLLLMLYLQIKEKKMNCPNCGNEIKENQKFCPKCGTKIVHPQIKLESETISKNIKFAFLKSKRFIAGVIILLFVIIGIGIFAVTNMYKIGQFDTYKSIVPIEQVQNLSTSEALNIMIQQDKDMLKFAKKSNKENTTKIFEVFYRNIINLAEILNADDLEIVDDNHYDYKLKNPTDLIGFQLNDWSMVWLNDSYIEKRYSKYLNDEWVEYLKLSSNSKVSYIKQFYDVKDIDVINDIKSWQDFLLRHQNFILSDKIKDNLKFLTSHIMYYNGLDGFEGPIKKTYVQFLNEINPKSEEYKIVKKCFDTLQQNNFKANSKFYSLLYNYNKYDYFKELYSNAKEQEENEIKEQEIKNAVNNSYTTGQNDKIVYTNKAKQDISKKEHTAPATGALRETDFKPYMEELQRRIEQNWTPPKVKKSKNVIVQIKIAKDGSLLSGQIMQSSGDQTFDETALNAVKSSAKYMALPANYISGSINIQIDFNTKVQGNFSYSSCRAIRI